MVLEGQLGQQALQVLDGHLGRVPGKDLRRFVGVLGDVVRGLGERAHHAGRCGLVGPGELCACADHAANAFGVLVLGAVAQFEEGAGVALFDQVEIRVAVGNGLDLALLGGHIQQVGRVDAPFDVLVHIQAALGQVDGIELLGRAVEIGHADGLALERAGVQRDAGRLQADQAQAAAVHAADELDIQPRLQRLDPAVDQARARIGLARGQRLQQLVGRAAPVQQLHVQAVALEEAALQRHGNGRMAEAGLAPGKGDLLARLRPGAAAEPGGRSQRAGCGAGADQGAARERGLGRLGASSAPKAPQSAPWAQRLSWVLSISVWVLRVMELPPKQFRDCRCCPLSAVFPTTQNAHPYVRGN